MAPWSQVAAGVSSVVARLSTYIFLRWIPGHHFPPIIFTAVAIYLTIVFGQSTAFGERRPKLSEVFPKLFGKEKQHQTVREEVQDEDHQHDEPALYDDEKTVLKTLLIGIPNWRESEYSYLTIFINGLMVLLTMDMVFRGPLLHPVQDLRFSRVGFVDQTSAKVLLREPDQSQLPVYAYLKASGASTWTTTDRIYYLSSETDFTYPITFSGLYPETTYTYSLSNDLSGTFTTAPAPYSPSANSLTFVTSSCIKANFPYRLLTNSLKIHGFESLSKALRSLPSPASFMLFLGDFIYVDVPLRLSASFLHYRSEYRRVYASPSWSLPGLSALPWLHTLDDHEIANDWSGGNDTAPFPAASDPFVHYHVSVNPPIPPSARNGIETNTTYFQFTHGPASFFMLDTRRYRTNPERASIITSTSNPSPNNHHSMLGQVQLNSLLIYLSTPEPPHIHFKIIASSVPFTKNWRFNSLDTWGGFPSERATILSAMHTAERTLGIRIIILSGDRHEFAAIRFPPPITTSYAPLSPSSSSPFSPSSNAASSSDNTRTTIYDRTPSSGPHEFSVGPLSMFYLPFRTFKQVDDEDVAIKYVPDGNSKFGVIDIRNLNLEGGNKKAGGGGGGEQKAMFKYTLWVDGEVQWEYVLTSPAPGYDPSAAGTGTGLRRGYGLWS